MPKAIGGVTALVALLAGVLCQVDPLVCLERSGLAFLLGWACGHIWFVLLAYAGASAASAGALAVASDTENGTIAPETTEGN